MEGRCTSRGGDDNEAARLGSFFQTGLPRDPRFPRPFNGISRVFRDFANRASLRGPCAAYPASLRPDPASIRRHESGADAALF
jgi:hypothetical protein